jgi:hypothetical protein
MAAHINGAEAERDRLAYAPLKAPFPWFGGKSSVADLVWERFGNVQNYVEPFFGSGAVLLNRPHAPSTETVNDLDCLLANFWRALQHEPEAVAEYADNPVNEADQHARYGHVVHRGAHDYDSLSFALLGCCDYSAEMRLLCKENM